MSGASDSSYVLDTMLLNLKRKETYLVALLSGMRFTRVNPHKTGFSDEQAEGHLLMANETS